MKYRILISLILISSNLLLATGNKNIEKTLRLIKVDTEIVIDGKIDETWNYADSTATFFQLEPYFNQPTSVQTIAKILTTEEALYCLMICYDDKENIQANAGMHDGYTGDTQP